MDRPVDRDRAFDDTQAPPIVFLAGAFGFIFAIEKTKNRPPVCRCYLHPLHGFDAAARNVLGLANGGSLILVAFWERGRLLWHGHVVERHKTRSLDDGQMALVGAVMLMVAMIANFFIQSDL